MPGLPRGKTFADGQSHYGETEGIGRKGQKKHWIFITAPMRDENGDIVAGMEMSIDITRRRHLEKDLKKSEEKYHAIFNNIFNPVFVVDQESLEILDCNIKAVELYHSGGTPLTGKLFGDFFPGRGPGGHDPAGEIPKRNLQGKAYQGRWQADRCGHVGGTGPVLRTGRVSDHHQ